jgi:hypothetical protein
MAQMVQYLSSKCMALSSNPSTEKKKLTSNILVIIVVLV